MAVVIIHAASPWMISYQDFLLVPVVWFAWGLGMFIFGTVFVGPAGTMLGTGVGRFLGFLFVHSWHAFRTRSHNIGTSADSVGPNRKTLVYFLCLLLEVLAATGFACYSELAKIDNNVALTSTLVSLYVVVPVAVGKIWLRERTTRAQAVGVVLAVVGGTLLGVAGNDSSQNGGRQGDIWLYCAYLAASFAAWGGAFTIMSTVHRLGSTSLILKSHVLGSCIMTVALGVLAGCGGAGALQFTATQFATLVGAQFLTAGSVPLVTHLSAKIGASLATPLCNG